MQKLKIGIEPAEYFPPKKVKYKARKKAKYSNLGGEMDSGYKLRIPPRPFSLTEKKKKKEKNWETYLCCALCC